MASSSKIRIDIDHKAFLSMIDPKVSKMLYKLDIDPLGVSIDSILLSVSPKDAESIVALFKKKGVKAAVVGKVSKGSGVFLILEAGKTQEMKHRFRESAYTPVKKVVDRTPNDLSDIKARIDDSALKAIEKKKRLLNRLAKNP